MVAIVNSGAVALVQGMWLAEHSTKGLPLSRRQELPPEAFWKSKELAKLMEESEALAVERWGIPAIPVVAVSYCWLTMEHPDPKGETLQMLGALVQEHVVYYRTAFED